MSKPGCYGLVTLISSKCASCNYNSECDDEHAAKYNLRGRGNLMERANPVINWPKRLRAEEKQKLIKDKSRLLPYENI